MREDGRPVHAMKTLFVFLQRLLPQHALSRLAGALAECRIPWLKNSLIRLFIRAFGVDMREAFDPDPRRHESFNAFFIRPLRADARPIDASPAGIACPADGRISQLGRIEDGRIFQAKGRAFTAAELLADSAHAAQYARGSFATIYLSPKDYHRVHMPLDGALLSETRIPGKLFSVNRATTEQIPRLFARNERLACRFDTPAGEMALVLVGAMIVAGIETAWQSRPLLPPGTAPPPVRLAKGAEMGRFKLGSTVILLFPENAVAWNPAYQAQSPVRMGEAIGRIL